MTGLPRPIKLGSLALVFYLPHAAWHVTHGHPWDLLWACNAAMPALALGCFLQNARMCAGAFLFLAFGTPMWLVDLASGAGMVLTSPLVHVGGLGLAAYAARAFGWPVGTWRYAAGAAALLLAVSRAVSDPAANVNLAFRVQHGWAWLPSHGLYVAGLWAGAALVFFVLERVARRLLVR